MPVVPVEGPHACRRVVEVTQPERGEIQAGGPALRPLDEELDVRGVERDPFPVDEQLTRLLGREREVARADLAQRTDRAEAPEAKRRVRARRHDETRTGGEMEDKPLERAPAGLVGQDVCVVEHDRHRRSVGLHAVRERVRDDRRRRAGRAEQREGRPPETRADAVDRRGEVDPEPGRIVVARLERHPRDGVVPPRDPRLDEHGLPEPDRCVDQRQRGRGHPVEPVEEPLPAHEARSGPCRPELRLDDAERGRTVGRYDSLPAHGSL